MEKETKFDIKILKETLTDINWSICSVGEPTGEGLNLGFKGWGNPHIVLDPAAPLDAQVYSLELEGLFKKVVSNKFLHLLHGDCTLTHGVKGLACLVHPEGELVITYLSIPDVMRLVLKYLDSGDFATAQILEKICFKPPIDSTGILFPQTMINKGKIADMLFAEGLNIEKIEGNPPKEILNIFPDTFQFNEIDDKVWEASKENFIMMDSLRYDRPTCLLCDSVVTKRDHDRRYFSRYCKNHYNVARCLFDQSLENLFIIQIVAKKEREFKNASKD